MTTEALALEEVIALEPEPEERVLRADFSSVRVPLGSFELARFVDRVRQLVSASWIEEIDVAVSSSPELLAQVIDVAATVGRRLRVRGDVTPAVLRQTELAWREAGVSDGETTWLLDPPGPHGPQAVAKRLVDIVGSAFLLVLLSPVLVLIGILVMVTSPGPPLYRWRVLGRNGRPFDGFKFRSMVREADTLKAGLLEQNEMSGPVFKMQNDPRVTPLGRFLRRYSLDELPQLWNVLVGDMSLIGPRPSFASEYAEFEPWQLRKLSITPGITCLWQVGGRNTINALDEWVRLDLRYIDEWSLRLDLRILLDTVKAVLRGTGV